MKLKGNNFSGTQEVPYRLNMENRGVCFMMNMSIMTPSGQWVEYDRCVYLKKENESTSEARKKLITGAEKHFGIELIKKEELLSKTA